MPEIDARLQLADLHDASIDSVSSIDGRVTIGGVVEGHRWNISIGGGKILICAPFLMGNIVSRVRIHEFGNDVVSNLEISPEIYGLFFDVYGPSVDDVSFVACRILEITSSYGCEILCLFEGMLDLELA